MPILRNCKVRMSVKPFLLLSTVPDGIIYVQSSLPAKYLMVPSYLDNFSIIQRTSSVFIGYEAKILVHNLKGE
jgi:hypothetical protein